jgi:hypothetical protein
MKWFGRRLKGITRETLVEIGSGMETVKKIRRNRWSTFVPFVQQQRSKDVHCHVKLISLQIFGILLQNADAMVQTQFLNCREH